MSEENWKLSIAMITPKIDGFFTRGEHEDHLGTILMFPERTDIWRDNAIHAQQLVIDLANVISEYEEVFFCVKPYLLDFAKKRLTNKVRYFEIEYDDIWARDVSPNFVVNQSEMRAVCWNFNAWGGLDEGAYFPWNKDAEFAKKLSDCLGIKKYIIDDVVLEGGAVIADGKGTVYTTKNVLLNKNRNPHKNIQELEDYLINYYCAEKIVWFDDGLVGDETNGHVDNLCSIVRPGEICLAWTEDENDPQYSIARNAMKILKASNTVKQIHKIPIPNAQFITPEETSGIIPSMTSTTRDEGFRLVPSYINYYLINSALIFPIFRCEEDEVAIQIIKKIHPDREILLFDGREPLIGGGGFHCILHEIPSLR